MKTEMLKKLSAKTIMGKIEKPTEPVELFTIYGIANGVKSGETTYGAWTALVGRFEAIKDDTAYTSTVAFIPEPLHGLIADAVRGGEGDVQFGCKVILKPRPDTAIGYEYIAEPIIEQSENDPLAALRETATKALEAPKAAKK